MEHPNYKDELHLQEGVSWRRKREIKKIIQDLRTKMWNELVKSYPDIAQYKNRYFDLSESLVYISDYFHNNKYPLKNFHIYDYHANIVI